MTRVLIADGWAARRELLRAALTESATPDPGLEPPLEVAGLARDGREALRLAHALRPEVVVLAADLPPDGGFAAAELLAASGLPLDSILTVEHGAGEEDLRRAMRAGAREVLCGPPEPAALRRAVRAVHADGLHRRSPAFAEGAGERAGGCLVAVTGAKGGVGKTTLAVNIAAALATETGQPTALLDLYTQFGDAALLLNLAPRRTLTDLACVEARDLDQRLVEDHLESHPCGLRVLAGASAPMAEGDLPVERLDALLSLLGRGHRYVVLDVPPPLSGATRHALSHASAVLLVAGLFDLATLADTRLWLEAMSGRHVAREACRVVVNRVSPRSRLGMAEVERVLGGPPDWLIPNDGRVVPHSVNAGVPFVLSHPGSRVAQAVRGLARSLSAGAAPAPPPRPRGLAFLAPSRGAAVRGA